MSERVQEITDDNFQSEVIDEDGLVVVDYYADWCGPCRVVGAIMEELKHECPDNLKIVKADINKNSATLSKFGVTGIPAILMFKKGKLVNKHVGVRTKKDLKKDIEAARKKDIEAVRNG